jgi:hypothetical protein
MQERVVLEETVEVERLEEQEVVVRLVLLEVLRLREDLSEIIQELYLVHTLQVTQQRPLETEEVMVLEEMVEVDQLREREEREVELYLVQL